MSSGSHPRSSTEASHKRKAAAKPTSSPSAIPEVAIAPQWNRGLSDGRGSYGLVMLVPAILLWSRALESCPGIVPWSRVPESCPGVAPGVVPWNRALESPLESCPGIVPWSRPWSRALESCPGIVPRSRAPESCPGVVPRSRAPKSSYPTASRQLANLLRTLAELPKRY
jgi:hypothetical protein